MSLLFCISFVFDGVGQINSDSLDHRQSGGAFLVSKLSGTVVDSSSGKPIPFCSIALHDTTGKQVMGGIGDEYGGFSISLAQTGIYSLSISSVGYLPKKLSTISVKDRVTYLGEIYLRVDSKQLEEVVVTGQRDLIEDKGDRLVYNAEKDISNMGGSAADVLRKVPLLAVDLNGNVQLRGSKNFRIFLNGKPSAMMAHNPADALRQIPGSNIKSVEVITSPGAKYDAEGTSGIININTLKKWEGFYGSAYGSVGNLYQSVGSSVTMQGKKLGISITGGASQYRSIGYDESYRTNLLDGKPSTRLYQRSEQDNTGPGANLGINLDYDPDSTSRFNLWLSGWAGNNPYASDLTSELTTSSGELIRKFRQDIQSSNSYIIGEVNMGYTKSFVKRQKTYTYSPFMRTEQPVYTRGGPEMPVSELSVLMQYSRTPARNFYQTDQYSSEGNVISYQERSTNLSKFGELTFQTDYSYPFKIGKRKDTTSARLEVGAKAIFRDIGSDYTLEQSFENSPDFVTDPTRSNEFDYTQKVVSGYMSLQLIMPKKWVLTSGARLEHTAILGNFVSTGTRINQQYQNLIPNVTLSRKFKDKHTVRFSYTQRITRPLIGYLNPFINYSNPQYLTTGNPDLNPELAHAAELNHSVFVGKNIFLNSALFFRQTNNAIEQVATVNSEGISISRPQNIARRKVLGLQANASIKPIKKMNISGGTTVQRFDSYSVALQQGNQGWIGSVTGNVSYSFPKKVSVQANGNYHTGLIILQGRTTGWYGYGFSLKKEIMKGKGSLNLTANTPFNHTIKQTNYRDAVTFTSYAYSANVTRSVMLTFFWQFGEYMYKEKQTRTITNDDKADNMKRYK